MSTPTGWYTHLPGRGSHSRSSSTTRLSCCRTWRSQPNPSRRSPRRLLPRIKQERHPHEIAKDIPVLRLYAHTRACCYCCQRTEQKSRNFIENQFEKKKKTNTVIRFHLN